MIKLFLSLVFILILSFSSLANANTNHPNILALTPIPYTQNENSALLEKLLKGSVEFVAQLTQMYPEYEIYFLSEDSQYLFDMARVLLKNSPQVNKMHLLDINAVNIESRNAKRYLQQEGIGEETLTNGKKILFVGLDSSTDLLAKIKSFYPSDMTISMKQHLVSSNNLLLPSSRLFLQEFNIAAGKLPVNHMQNTLFAYKRLPKFHQNGATFRTLRGRLVARAQETLSAKRLRQEASLGIMQAILAYASQASVQAHYQTREELWRGLYQMQWKGRDSFGPALRNFILNNPLDVSIKETVLKDFLEIMTKNYHRHEVLVARDFNFESLPEVRSNSNIAWLMENYPELRSKLENIPATINDLKMQGDFLTLGMLVDIVDDPGFDEAISLAFASDPLNMSERAFLENMIVSSPRIRLLTFFANNLFRRDHGQDYSKFFSLLLERRDNRILNALAIRVFSYPHNNYMQHLLPTLIENGDQWVWYFLAQFSFSRPHTENMQEMILMVYNRMSRHDKEFLLSQLGEARTRALLAPFSGENSCLQKLLLFKNLL